MTERRDHDLVLVGATGFTGGLTAAYLARQAPAGLRWALAGRSLGRLETVRARLAHTAGAAAAPALLVADTADPSSMDAVAASARVVVTTVGPYLRHGEPLVAACARHGTDYLDISGESEFVDRMWLAHHETARASGARLVHACGFESVPFDLGALMAVEALRPPGALRLRGVVRASGAVSGGTWHSAVGQVSRSREARAARRARGAAEPGSPGRLTRAVLGRPRRDAELGLWLLPLPTIDAQVVARSAAALPVYGPDFGYAHYLGVRRLPAALACAAGATGGYAAAHVPPLRAALLAALPQGSGPDEARRGRSRFSVDLVGGAGGRRVHVRVSGGDPGYGETATMLAEAALCLLFDDNPPTAGQVTTAVAMGARLTARLQSAGVRFDVLDP